MAAWRLCLLVCHSFVHTTWSELRTDQKYWKDLAKNELTEALQVRWNTNLAKNVILFVGDGMGPNTVTATRIYRGGETHRLVYETFPHMGMLKTYSANKMVPDSSCTATALFCGVKANQETIGVDATVRHKDCEASLRPEARLKSLAELALNAGKRAGLVTTMRVTHATPGPIYAHSADRKWECEATMPASASGCKDHARQLVEDSPGKDLHVILGGGRQVLVSNSTGTPADPLDTWSCIRKDGRDLIQTYKADKEHRHLKYRVVTNTRQLNVVKEDTDYLLGIFANGHIKYEHERDKGPEGMPSLSDMVAAAIRVLRKKDRGYFLMVEGGNIDFAHHRGKAKTAINEAAAMEEAVKVAMALTDEADTLLVVTADHTHTLSINGYPYRGTNIFGVAPPSPVDGANYTTLSYATGGPGSYKYYVKQDNNQSTVVWKDPTQENTDDFDYEQLASVRLDENSHGGGDVAIYARGPYSHLFHNIHEQHYVYEAISFAAKIGDHSGAEVNAMSHVRVAVLALLALMVTFI